MTKIKSIFNSISSFLLKYKFTILALSFIFGLTTILRGSYHNNTWITVVAFFFLLNALGKIKSKYAIASIAIVGFLLVIDLYFIVAYGEKLTFGILKAVLDANINEVQSLFISTTLKFLVLYAAVTILFYQAAKELKETKPSTKISFAVFFAYWIIFIPILSCTIINKNKNFRGEFESHPAYFTYHNISSKAPIVLRAASLYFCHIEQIKPIEAYLTSERTLPEGISFDSTAVTPLNIYVVIGESAIRSHFSLYGYSHKTTPFLDSISKVDKTFKYYDAISSAPLTSMAIPMVLTSATPLDETPLFKKNNLIELANMANYETYWLSSQPKYGSADTQIGVFASTAKDIHYLEQWPPEDINLVHEMQNRFKKGTKQFFILHQEGSHMDYKPHFDATDKKALNGSWDTANYDRTIHHTDRFFRELYHTAESNNEPYVILYFSDHGEVIGKGHGFVNESSSQFEIPFLSIYKGDCGIDSLVSKYTNKETKIINNTSTFNIISELIGYKFTEEETSKVLEASKFIKHADHNIYLYEELKNNEKK